MRKLMRLPRFTLMRLLFGVAVVAIVVSIPPGAQRREIYTIRRLCADHYFDSYVRPVRWLTPPPAVIAFVEWKGPKSLESPMRAIGCPWFDRIIRIDISDDSQIDPDYLKDVQGLRYLNCIAIHNTTIARTTYAEIMERTVGKIEFVFDSGEPYYFLSQRKSDEPRNAPKFRWLVCSAQMVNARNSVISTVRCYRMYKWISSTSKHL